MPNPQPKTILITGVTRRVGAHLAQHLLAQGHRVIGTYRHDNATMAELRDLGLLALPCDLNDPNSIQALAEQVRDQVDTLDAVVHNASIWHNDEACAAAP